MSQFAKYLVVLFIALLGVTPLINAVGELPAICMVAAGGRHSLALATNGTVWVWGENDSGQLGVGARVYPTTPRTLNLTSVAMVAAGKEFSLALTRNGEVWAWGNNSDGEIGDGSDVTAYEPVRVQGLAGVKAIAAGDRFALALLNDGSVWSWGRNNDGQLGHGTFGRSESRPRCIEGLRNIRQITAGIQSAMAIDADGTVWAWGANDYGQLGLGKRIDYADTPTRVPGLRAINKISIAYQTVALASDGTLWCWGSNDYGQLGLGKGTAKTIYEPQLLTGINDVEDIAVGASHTLFLKENGRVYACGCNDHGQLGDDSTTSQAQPQLCGAMQGIVTLSAGNAHNLAVDDLGNVWAWGHNVSNQVDASGKIQLPFAVKLARVHGEKPSLIPGNNTPTPPVPGHTQPDHQVPKQPVTPVLPLPSREPVGAIIYNSAGKMKICRMDVKTGAEQVFTFNGTDLALSPDRKTLVYLNNKGNLRVYHLDNGSDVTLSDPDSRQTFASPTFVGNDTVAYLTESRNYSAMICMTPLNRFAERPWSGTMPEHTTVGSSTLRWVPGSNPQAPSFVLGNVNSIMLLTPQKTATVVAADPKSGVSLRYPAVNPDGKSIAFERDAAEDSIWTIGIDGKNLRQLTKRDSGFPSWSPDGRYLVFLTTAVAERGLLKRDIYITSVTSHNAGFFLFGIGIMRVDGTPLKSLCDRTGKPIMTHGDSVVWQ